MGLSKKVKCTLKVGQVKHYPVIERVRYCTGLFPFNRFDSFIVVIINIFIQSLYKGFRRLKFLGIKQFGFHYAEEVFSHGIVKTIAFSGHTLDYIVILKTLSVSEVLILPSLIRMYYKPVKIIGVLRAALSAPRK